MIALSELLPPRLFASLLAMGVRTPTPIQSVALPSIIKDRCDAVITAETGSGKTLLYALPILARAEVCTGRVCIVT